MSKRSSVLAASIREQILNALKSGLWQHGAKLPSTRVMSARLGVNTRLVTRAYEELANEGLVELRPRSGAYIATDRPLTRGLPAGITERWIVKVLAETVRLEAPASKVAEWLRRATDTVRLRAFVIAPTTDQVEGLKRELRVFYGLEAFGATIDELSIDVMPVELVQADLIISIESTWKKAAELARAVGAAEICVSVRGDIVGPVWESFMRAPTYVVVSDVRFGAVLASYLSGKQGASAVNVLVAGRDDTGMIPSDAVVYVTEGARIVLGEQPLNGMILPQVQVISTKSSSVILQFIVAANMGAVRAREGLLAGPE